ncbi:MAG: hypothetical protein RLZZ453_906 [Chlamydiota bacterium]|jgi:hypothetical protein
MNITLSPQTTQLLVKAFAEGTKKEIIKTLKNDNKIYDVFYSCIIFSGWRSSPGSVIHLRAAIADLKAASTPTELEQAKTSYCYSLISRVVNLGKDQEWKLMTKWTAPNDPTGWTKINYGMIDTISNLLLNRDNISEKKQPTQSQLRLAAFQKTVTIIIKAIKSKEFKNKATLIPNLTLLSFMGTGLKSPFLTVLFLNRALREAKQRTAGFQVNRNPIDAIEKEIARLITLQSKELLDLTYKRLRIGIIVTACALFIWPDEMLYYGTQVGNAIHSKIPLPIRNVIEGM